MDNRHAIISGGSIAGLSAAFWLASTGWRVTVIERAPAFREGGQNIDVRGVARDVLTKMGLFEAVQAENTTETGAVIVDQNGRVTAELPSANEEGKGGATAELEVLRGDLAHVILDALPDGVSFIYGDAITSITDGPGHVEVTTRAGLSLSADLLVIAEGVRSSSRELVFRGEADATDLDVTMVFGTIPRTPSDDDRWRWHNTVGGRQIHLRPDNHGTIRTILAYSPGSDLAGLDRTEMLATVRARYAGAGWETTRILDALDSYDDVYIDQLTQIRMPTWHRGRVAIAGDAAWCVTPMGGGGASLALTSGYVLAAYLRSETSLDAALSSYDTWMRPLVDDVQKLPAGMKSFAYPQTQLGLRLRKLADRAMTSRLLMPVAAKLTQVAETHRELPPLPIEH